MVRQNLPVYKGGGYTYQAYPGVLIHPTWLLPITSNAFRELDPQHYSPPGNYTLHVTERELHG